MKKALKAIAVATFLASASTAGATPSTVVWTPATTYTQPFLVPHVTYDTYFGEQVLYPVDLGLTVGVIPPNAWVEGEVGVDAFYPLSATPAKDESSGPGAFETKNAFQLNGKLSLKEGALHAHAPGLSVGIMNAGLTKDLNDYNILYAVVGKTLGAFGTVTAGVYQGNDKLLLSIPDPASGDEPKKDETGFLASYASPKLPVGRAGLKDVALGVDYQSGDSAFGALAAAAVLYFTDAVSLLTGPVFFNNEHAALNGKQLAWTVQLDVDVDFGKAK